MKKQITYKQAIHEIEEIITRIENEELDVDELGKHVKKASELLSYCKKKLTTTEKEIEKIMESMNHNLDED